MLVSLVLLGLASALATSYSGARLKQLAFDSVIEENNRLANQAMASLSYELRTSQAISPFIPGSEIEISNCHAARRVENTKIFFMRSIPSASDAQGRLVKYISYHYDRDKKHLLRGEVTMSSLTTCTSTLSDPSAKEVSKIIATGIVEVDEDGDGVVDPIFTEAKPQIIINLGLERPGIDGTNRKSIPLQAAITIRSWS
jgi:hypothetical protein